MRKETAFYMYAFTPFVSPQTDETQAVLRLISVAIDLMESREEFMSAASKVIDVCFNAGVPFDDQDPKGR